jgi:hypothetical protein
MNSTPAGFERVANRRSLAAAGRLRRTSIALLGSQRAVGNLAERTQFLQRRVGLLLLYRLEAPLRASLHAVLRGATNYSQIPRRLDIGAAARLDANLAERTQFLLKELFYFSSTVR